MKRAVALVMFGIVVLLSVSAQAAGSGEEVIRLNGGDDVTCIGEDKILKIWIRNDAVLTMFEFPFTFFAGGDGHVDSDDKFAMILMEETGDAVGAFLFQTRPA